MLYLRLKRCNLWTTQTVYPDEIKLITNPSLKDYNDYLKINHHLVLYRI